MDGPGLSSVLSEIVRTTDEVVKTASLDQYRDAAWTGLVQRLQDRYFTRVAFAQSKGEQSLMSRSIGPPLR